MKIVQELLLDGGMGTAPAGYLNTGASIESSWPGGHRRLFVRLDLLVG